MNFGIITSILRPLPASIQRTLLSLHPDEPLPPVETTRRMSEDRIRVTLTLDDALVAKLDRIKEVISHAHPHLSYAELLDYMAKPVLDRVDPVRKAARAQSKAKQNVKSKALT